MFRKRNTCCHLLSFFSYSTSFQKKSSNKLWAITEVSTFQTNFSICIKYCRPTGKNACWINSNKVFVSENCLQETTRIQRFLTGLAETKPAYSLELCVLHLAGTWQEENSAGVDCTCSHTHTHTHTLTHTLTPPGPPTPTNILKVSRYSTVISPY